MLKKQLNKNECGKFCNNTIWGDHIFFGHMQGQIDELAWGFLKKGMKIYPHKHAQKETYIFINGRGVMKVENEEFEVQKGDTVFIEPNMLHTAWNNEEADLEFIIVKTKKVTIPAAFAALLRK